MPWCSSGRTAAALRASPASATYLAAGNGGAYDVRILDPVKNGLTPWKSVP
jgi:hypothetical protein